MDLQLEHGIDRALAALPPGLDPLQAGTRLRRSLDPERARAAAELYELRRRAADKLPDAPFLTRRGLEQASDHRVAAARGRRIRRWNPQACVLDATCGIGGDTLALAELGLRVVACDRDGRNVALARANLERNGNRLWVARAVAEHPAVRADCLLLDPDRRTKADGGRSSTPALSAPTWSEVVRLLPRFRAACVKLAPAASADELAPDLPPELPRTWQWVSLGRELKELALWTGELAWGAARGSEHRAVLALDRSGGEVNWGGSVQAVAPLELEAARCVAWIAEPDPAVIRSGLLGALAASVGFAPLAPRIAYLGGDQRPASPLLSRHAVLDSSPLDPRLVRQMLAHHGIGPLTVKKRGHPEEAAALERRFRGKGTTRGVLLVSRLEKGHHAYLVRPDSPPEAPI